MPNQYDVPQNKRLQNSVPQARTQPCAPVYNIEARQLPQAEPNRRASDLLYSVSG